VDNLRLGLLEGGPEIFRGEALVPMDDLEHPFEGVEQLLAVGAGGPIGQRGEELDIATQMGDAALHGDMEVLPELAVGREIVAAQGALELLAQDLDQDLRAAGVVDTQQPIALGLEDPAPEPIAVVLMAGLIHIQGGLQRDAREQLLIGPLQGLADLLDDFGQITARDLLSQNVADELADGREGGVTEVLQVDDQRCQPGLEQPFPEDLRGKLGVLALPARFTPIGIGAVLLAGHHDLFDLGLLNDAWGQRLEDQGVRSLTAWAAG